MREFSLGQLACAVYLIHRMTKGAVDHAVSYGSSSVVGRPMIQLGRRLASMSRGERTLPVGIEMSRGS
jgi:hypothetical protein